MVENMDNFTALYTTYLRFTFGTNLMHTSPHAYPPETQGKKKGFDFDFFHMYEVLGW